MTVYGNVAGFKTYHEARGREISASWSDDSINAALLVGSEWIDNKFGSLFYGQPTGGFLQDREWPRESAYTNTLPSYVFAADEIPDRVVQSAYEAALRELNEPDSLLTDYNPSEFTSVRVEGAIDVTYAGITQASEIQKQIIIVEQLLSPLLNFSKGGMRSGIAGSSVRT